MSVGRGRGLASLTQQLQDGLPTPRTFGRGRARCNNPCNDDDDSSMALLRRQLELFCAQTPPTPETPSAPGQFADSDEAEVFYAPSSGHTSGRTSGAVTPKRRPRCASEVSSNLSTPRSASSYSFRGDDDPDCVCYRDKKRVICRMCGDAYLGRVRRKCSVHCNVKMLMDNDLCAKCGIPCLFEYDQDGIEYRD